MIIVLTWLIIIKQLDDDALNKFEQYLIHKNWETVLNELHILSNINNDACPLVTTIYPENTKTEGKALVIKRPKKCVHKA